MERRRTSFRRARLLGVALLVVSGATACEGIGPVGQTPAATVNGHDISRAEVEAAVDLQLEYLDKLEPIVEKQRLAAQQKGEQVISKADYAARVDAERTPYRGDTSASLGTAGATTQLNRLVRLEIYRDALRITGVKVTKAQKAAAKEQVEQQQLTDNGLKLADVPKGFLDDDIEVAGITAAIEATAPVSKADQEKAAAAYEQTLQAAFQQQAESYTQLCVKGIVAADEASGTQAATRLKAGEDAAAVAKDLSVEPTSADQEQCLARADAEGLFPEAATAKAGTVLGPTPYQTNQFLVLVVGSVKVPTYEDLRPQLAQSIPDTAAQAATAAQEKVLAKALNAATDRAKVSVDSRYGTWDAKAGQVVAPADPAAVAFESDGSTPSTTVDPAAGAPAAAGS